MLLTSCSVLSIHHRSDAAKGVPFFVRTSLCRHELVWLEPIYRLTLQSVSQLNGKETVTTLGSADFSLSDYTANQQDITSLKNAILNGGNPVQMWSVIQTHAYNSLARPEPDPRDIVLISNVNKTETTVDYRDVYYFNSHRPLLGTAKADIKLASDGTMTEGSGEIESKTLQSFLDLVPTKELISAAAGLPAGGAPPGAPAFRLQIESRAIKHTHYRYRQAESDHDKVQCLAVPAARFDDQTYNREREDSSDEKPEKKDDKNTVNVKGEIKLPPKDDGK